MGTFLLRQRELTVFVVVVLLTLYFGVISSTGRAVFFEQADLINLGQIAAPIIIIALGEVLLLICGEIDISVGFIYAFTPYIMYFLISLLRRTRHPRDHPRAGLRGGDRLGQRLSHGHDRAAVVHHDPGHRLRPLRHRPVTMAHGEQAPIPAKVLGIGHWLGNDAWAEIIWAVVLVVVFHVLSPRTRWGLHTIAVGGNLLGPARPASTSPGSSTGTS